MSIHYKSSPIERILIITGENMSHKTIEKSQH